MPEAKKKAANTDIKALIAKSGGKKAGKKSRKLGRDKKDCLRYRSNMTRERYKIRNLFRSNGVAEARKYAEGKGLLAFYEKRFAKLIDKRKIWKVASGA